MDERPLGPSERQAKSRRRFSLQPAPANLPGFLGKMGRRLSASSANSPASGSTASVNERQRRGASDQSQCSSQEELDRQFADFDAYLGAPVEQERRGNATPDALPVPKAGRQRSHSMSQAPALAARFAKMRLRHDSTEHTSSERPKVSSGSMLAAVASPAGCSLALLPEGVQVHHQSSPPASDDEAPARYVKRKRSSTVSAAANRLAAKMERRRRSSADAGPAARERSASLCARPAPALVVTPPDADGRDKRRRFSISQLLRPLSAGARYDPLVSTNQSVRNVSLTERHHTTFL